MVEVAVMKATSSSDMGGAVISRFHFKSASGNAIQVADLTAAAFQFRAFYSAFNPHLAANYLWDVNAEFTIIDENTGGLLRYMTDPGHQPGSPGSGSISHVAGSGLRVTFRTVTVSTKRLMRGAIFVTPLSTNDTTNTGGPTPALVTAATNAAQSLIAGLAAAGLTPVVYHRPPKGQTTGGKSGPITSAEVPNKFTSLRSRRA